MKKLLSFLFLITFLASAQENSAPAEEAEKQTTQLRYITELEALTSQQKRQYFIHYKEAERFFNQKRIFECLHELHSLDLIYDGNPASLNLQGACYVEFRNFDKARKIFAKALSSNPGNFNIRFNIAEIDFVTKDYSKSLKQFQDLIQEAEAVNHSSSMLPLIKFKIQLCMLKTGDMEGAEQMMEGSDFLDDTPFFYYGNAALEYHADRGIKAEVWLARAGRIFKNTKITAPWQDTLIEFGYIKSFYGGDLEVETISPTGE